MAINVMFYGLGPIGSAVARQVAGRKGFKIVGANADRVLELPYDDKVRAEYVSKIGIKFTTAYLNPKMQNDYGGVSVFPTMFFVDKNGIIVKHFVNFQEKATLEAAIQAAMGKTGN